MATLEGMMTRIWLGVLGSLLVAQATLGTASRSLFAVAQDSGVKQDMKDAGKSTEGAAKKTGDATKKAATATGHATAHGAKKSGEATESGVKTAGKATEHAGKTTGKATEHAATQTGSTMKKGATKMVHAMDGDSDASKKAEAKPQQ